MAQSSRGKSAVNNSALYKTSKRWETNRRRKLEKQLKLQPNNEKVKLALKDIHYRRKSPKSREWSHSWIAIAKLFKLFGGRFDRSIMGSNKDSASVALQKQSPKAALVEGSPRTSMGDKNFFSIAARVNGGKGL